MPEAPDPFFPSCRCLPVQVSRSALQAVLLSLVLPQSPTGWRLGPHEDPAREVGEGSHSQFEAQPL